MRNRISRKSKFHHAAFASPGCSGQPQRTKCPQQYYGRFWNNRWLRRIVGSPRRCSRSGRSGDIQHVLLTDTTGYVSHVHDKNTDVSHRRVRCQLLSTEWDTRLQSLRHRRLRSRVLTWRWAAADHSLAARNRNPETTRQTTKCRDSSCQTKGNA